MRIEVSDDIAQIINDQLKSGKYAAPEDVVADAIQVMCVLHRRMSPREKQAMREFLDRVDATTDQGIPMEMNEHDRSIYSDPYS